MIPGKLFANLTREVQELWWDDQRFAEKQLPSERQEAWDTVLKKYPTQVRAKMKALKTRLDVGKEAARGGDLSPSDFRDITANLCWKDYCPETDFLTSMFLSDITTGTVALKYGSLSHSTIIQVRYEGAVIMREIAKSMRLTEIPKKVRFENVVGAIVREDLLQEREVARRFNPLSLPDELDTDV